MLALPLGIFKKFGEDEGGSMVSLIAYRAFFSLFPLLLLMTTILGYVLAGNEELHREVVNSTLSQFPIIGNQLKGGSLRGSGVALAVGIVGSVLAGLGVVLETEQTFNRCWGVPKSAERGFVGSRLRGSACWSCSAASRLSPPSFPGSPRAAPTSSARAARSPAW